MKNYLQKTTEAEPKDLQSKTPLVTQYMVPVEKLVTFTKDTPISEVIDTLLTNKITGAPVLNERGGIIGLIDDKDCLKMLISGAYYNHPVGKNTVSNYMSDVMKSISTNTDIVAVANTFLTTPYKRLLILDKTGKLAGQISRHDVLRAIQDVNASTW